MNVLLFEKKDTETLALCLERFRSRYPEYAKSPITYAGRLDPMAEGLLLLLTDDDIYQKDSYLGLDKVYEASCIFGVSTDSYDVLGCVEASRDAEPELHKEDLAQLEKMSKQAYPPFSSRKVKGKPLFIHAKEGSLDTIDIPSHDITIYSLSYLHKELYSAAKLKEHILGRIAQVVGDFRQEACQSSWKDYFATTTKKEYVIHHFRIHVSSGTYIRSLIKTLGDILGVPATCVHIKRVHIEGLPKNITLLV